MNDRDETNPRPPRPSHSIERMYVLCFVGWLSVLLLVILLALLGRDRLSRQAETLAAQSTSLEQLEEAVAQLRKDSEASRARREPPKDQASEATDTAAAAAPETVEQEAEAGPAAEQASHESLDIKTLLTLAIGDADGRPAELRDIEAARSAVNDAMNAVADAEWNGETWCKLAVVARLLDRDAPAEMFALKALAGRHDPVEYYEVSARRLLERGESAEAVIFAGQLTNAAPNNQEAALLLAEIHYSLRDRGAVADALDGITAAQDLPVRERLRLGQLLIYSEQWVRLQDVISGFTAPPPEAFPELNQLRAVAAIKDARLPEALAILDGLLEDAPDDYDLMTWRGVALLEAQQYAAAREALAHAVRKPDRPEAWYWLGVVELRVGEVSAAVERLNRSLAADGDYPPALEMLATIALNSGDENAAADFVADSIAANPRRASAHFLMAITSAKLLRSEATYSALRRAIELDPELIGTAQRTGVFGDLITQQQWRELADIAGGSAD